MNEIDVSVIILNYKTPQMCCDCITSLFEHSSNFTFEIIVIDNASGDNSKEIITDKFDSKIRYIQNEKNLGTAKAFNQGAKLAKGRYLFYLNTDILFINNAIYEQLQLIKSRDDIAVVGGNLFNSSMKPTHSYQKHFFGLKRMWINSTMIGVLLYKLTAKLMSREFNYRNYPKKVDYVCAAATLMRKDVYEKTGGFDEEIFMYGEEALYAYTCMKNGYYSYNTPNSKIIHFEGDSFRKDVNNFSEGRCKRFYDGMSIHIKKIYGKEKLNFYFKCVLRNLRNKKILFWILRKKNQYYKANSEYLYIKKHYIGRC